MTSHRSPGHEVEVGNLWFSLTASNCWRLLSSTPKNPGGTEESLPSACSALPLGLVLEVSFLWCEAFHCDLLKSLSLAPRLSLFADKNTNSPRRSCKKGWRELRLRSHTWGSRYSQAAACQELQRGYPLLTAQEDKHRAESWDVPKAEASPSWQVKQATPSPLSPPGHFSL